MCAEVVRYRDQASFTLDEPKGDAAFFVLGVRKSGSSILNSIVGALANMNGFPFIDVGGTLFESGILVKDWQRDKALGAILRPGHVYGGFRNYPICLADDPLFKKSPKIFLIRDPRDALVSEYFSNAFSHSIPAAGNAKDLMQKSREQAQTSAVNEYVLTMAKQLKRVLNDYKQIKLDRNCKIFRYEDVIFDKAQLIADICTCFGWTVSAEQTQQILGWADVLPSEERPTEFIRRVRPGDHLEKLSPDVISQLNVTLAEDLASFGYG